jgi:hypothetical protein
VVKVSEQWKALEKLIAKKVGGTRLIRGNDFGVSMLDVEHPWLAIDAKWRSELAVVTWYLKLVKDCDKIYKGQNKIPILVIKKKGMRGELAVILLDDFIKVCNDEKYKITSKEIDNDE